MLLGSAVERKEGRRERQRRADRAPSSALLAILPAATANSQSGNEFLVGGSSKVSGIFKVPAGARLEAEEKRRKEEKADCDSVCVLYSSLAAVCQRQTGPSFALFPLPGNSRGKQD